jgi:hypothetical protein
MEKFGISQPVRRREDIRQSCIIAYVLIGAKPVAVAGQTLHEVG